MRFALSVVLAAFCLLGSPRAQFTRGSVQTYGSGCGDSAAIAYELFPSGARVDLDGSSLTWELNARGSYSVRPTSVPALPFGAASSTAIALDTSSTAVQERSLATFTFPYAGRSGAGETDRIWIGPNFGVYLRQSADERCCGGAATVAGMTRLRSSESFAIFGSYIDASASSGSGRIWFDEQQVGSHEACVITWDGVTEAGAVPPLSHTYQMQLQDDGTVHFVYLQMDVPSLDAAVGFSAGGPQPDFGSVDLSAGPRDLDSGRFRYRVRLDPYAISLPVAGYSFEVAARHTNSGAVAAAMLLGAGRVAVPLDASGSPFCLLLTDGRYGVVPAIFTSDRSTVDFGRLPAALAGAGFTLQCIVLDPSSPVTRGILTSDGAEVTVGDDPFLAPGIAFQSSGPDSFNSDPTSGFWSIRHDDAARQGLRITALTIDISPPQRTFDLTQPVNERFDGGNRGLVGCRNTYRNASDAATGLVWAGSDASRCDPLAVGTGFRTLNPQSAFPDLLTFWFSDFQFGEVFEFDADTDGLGGESGDAHAGTNVTVWFSDGSSASGTTFVWPNETAGVIL